MVPPCEDSRGYGTHKEVDGECVERPCEERDTPHVQLSDFVGCVKADSPQAVFCSSESRAILKIFDETLPWSSNDIVTIFSDSTAVTEETAVADRDNSGYISALDYISYLQVGDAVSRSNIGEQVFYDYAITTRLVFRRPSSYLSGTCGDD